MKPYKFAILSVLGIVQQVSAATQYYGGSFNCPETESSGYVEFSVTDDNPAQVVLLWGPDRNDNYIETAGEVDWKNNSGEIALSRDTAIRVEGKKATWIYDGKVNPDCRPFELTQKKTPLEEADDYIEMLKAGDTSVENIKSVIEASNVMQLTMHLLPELDRSTVINNIGEAQGKFWEKAETDRLNTIKTLPVEGDGKAYAQAVLPLLDLDMGPDGSIFKYPDGEDQLINASFLAAYHLALAGADPMVISRPLDEVCARSRSLRSGNMQNIATVATGIPFTFWDRDFTQQILDEYKRCDISWGADWIVDNYPNIQKYAEMYDAAIGKVKDILAMPDNYETLVNTNGLHIDQEIMEKYDMDFNYLDLISAGELSAKREKIIKDTQNNIKSIISDALKKDESDSEYYLCRNLFEISGSRELINSCEEIAPNLIAESKIEKILSTAKGIDTIEEARNADWFQLPYISSASEELMSKANNELDIERKRIADLILAQAKSSIEKHENVFIDDDVCPRDYYIPAIIEEAIKNCTTMVRQHNNDIKEAQCDEKMNVSDIDEIKDDSIILYNNFNIKNTIPLRQFVCDIFDDEKIEVGSESWIGTKRDLTITFGEGEEIIHATIESKEKGIWEVIKVKGWAPRNAEDNIAVCLMGSHRCKEI